MANPEHLAIIKQGVAVWNKWRQTQYQGLDLSQSDTGNDSAPEISEYFIPDLPNWKHEDSYQQAFEQFLSGLKGGKSAVQLN